MTTAPTGRYGVDRTSSSQAGEDIEQIGEHDTNAASEATDEATVPFSDLDRSVEPTALHRAPTPISAGQQAPRAARPQRGLGTPPHGGSSNYDDEDDRDEADRQTANSRRIPKFSRALSYTFTFMVTLILYAVYRFVAPSPATQSAPKVILIDETVPRTGPRETTSPRYPENEVDLGEPDALPPRNQQVPPSTLGPEEAEDDGAEAEGATRRAASFSGTLQRTFGKVPQSSSSRANVGRRQTENESGPSPAATDDRVESSAHSDDPSPPREETPPKPNSEAAPPIGTEPPAEADPSDITTVPPADPPSAPQGDYPE